MTDREKIVEIIESNKICVLAMDCADCPYRDKLNKTYSCGSYKLDDTLLAANIGDVTEWKEKVECAKRILQIPALPNGTTDFSYFEYKGERIQDIARQRDEYKRRAEVAERAFDNTIKVCHEILSAIFPDEKIDLDEWKKDNLAIAEKELAEK